jgi:hypothetical protein
MSNQVTKELDLQDMLSADISMTRGWRLRHEGNEDDQD